MRPFWCGNGNRLRPIPRSCLLATTEAPAEKILMSYAEFGDSLINFLFSCSYTKLKGEPIGTKVPNSVLHQAAVESGLRGKMRSGLDRKEISNEVEARLAEAYLDGKFTIDDATKFLSEALAGADEGDKQKEIDALKIFFSWVGLID